jgi:hypothetical protein
MAAGRSRWPLALLCLAVVISCLALGSAAAAQEAEANSE